MYEKRIKFKAFMLKWERDAWNKEVFASKKIN